MRITAVLLATTALLAGCSDNTAVSSSAVKSLLEGASAHGLCGRIEEDSIVNDPEIDRIEFCNAFVDRMEREADKNPIQPLAPWPLECSPARPNNGSFEI